MEFFLDNGVVGDEAIPEAGVGEERTKGSGDERERLGEV